MSAVEQLRMQVPDGPLYHYTTAAGLIGILKTRSFWATSHRHLNDKREYQIAARLLKAEITKLRLKRKYISFLEKHISQEQSTYFIVCFSQSRNLLSQWRGYSPEGNGYSLGFRPDHYLFSSARQHAFNLVKCEYNKTKQMKLCRELLNEYVDAKFFDLKEDDHTNEMQYIQRRTKWEASLALLMAAFKHESFSEENEWRLVSQERPEDIYRRIYYRAGRFGITPYCELPMALGPENVLDHLIVGPNSNRSVAQEAARMLVKSFEIKLGELTISQVPLRL